MQIQVNTDHNVEGHEKLAAHFTGVVEYALRRFGHHIARVDVHLGDESSNKTTPNDQRCMMEAHLEGRAPVVATHHASTLKQAVDGAAKKLTRLMEDSLGRQHDKKTRGHDDLSSHEPADGVTKDGAR